jgi:hypothetical protein
MIRSLSFDLPLALLIFQSAMVKLAGRQIIDKLFSPRFSKKQA